MPKLVNLTNKEYFNALRHETDFTENLAESTVNLAGCVGEPFKAVLYFEIECYAVGTNSAPITVDTLNHVISYDGNFYDDGLAEGDDIRLWDGLSGTLALTGNIDSITPDGKRIYYTWISGDDGGTGSGSYQDGSRVTLSSTPDGVIFKWGINDNDDDLIYTNAATGNEQVYYSSGMSSSFSFQPGYSLGIIEDWVDGDFIAKRDNTSFTGNRVIFTYVLEHKFVIPAYKDGDAAAIESGIPRDELKGSRSYKHSFEATFYSLLSNPNSGRGTTVDTVLGSVADFGENFNGFNNRYELFPSVATGDFVEFYEFGTLNLADGLLVSGTTTCFAIINKPTGTLSASYRVGVMVQTMADPANYIDTTATDYFENFHYDYARVLCDGVDTDDGYKGIITDLVASFNASSIILRFEVTYPIDMQNVIDDQTKFIIGFNIADPNFPVGSTDRVMLLGHSGFFDNAADVDGLFEVKTLEILDHTQVLGTDTGSTDMIAENEEELCFDITFDLDTSREAEVLSMKGILAAFNPTGNLWFPLDSYNFDLTSSVVSGVIQNINIVGNRGYTFDPNHQFNKVEISTGALVGIMQGYRLTMGQRISWESWDVNTMVPTSFYDAAQANNNFNHKSSNYSGVNGYDIKMMFYAEVLGFNQYGSKVVTKYHWNTPVIEVSDYGNFIIETYDYDISTNTIGVDLLGSVLVGAGKYTYFKIIWTGQPYSATAKVRHRIESEFDTSKSIEMLSSHIVTPLTDSLLGITDVNFVEVLNESGDLASFCLIDGSKLSEGTKYCLSGELDGEEEPIPDGAKITDDGIFKATEEDHIKIIDE